MNINTAEEIVHWYDKNKRSLPWRDTNNPYDVWLSEIMLQQTRIDAVKPKYELFKKNLPDIASLAACEDDALMRLWEGLGYYSRARNLKKCANALVEQYAGKLPAAYDALIKLPGIGPYTAGAISSIAYDMPVPAVDGNVLRVLARYFGIKDDVRNEAVKKKIQDTIQDLYETKQKKGFFSSFNQGLMEIGEVVCVPNGAPHCDACPLQEKCICCKKKLYEEIPYRSSLKERKIIERTLLILRDGDSFLLHKRDEKGLLAGLYEFIGIDETLNEKQALKEAERMGAVPVRITHLPEAKHIFTHLEWYMHAYEIQVEQIEQLKIDHCILANKKELASLAIPSAFKTYINWYSLRDQ
jgi:A/G-specific adenine glycosylase